MLSTFLFAWQVWVAPAAELSYVTPPALVTIEEQKAKKSFAVVERGASLKAQLDGPGTLTLEVRAPLKKGQKALKGAAVVVKVDTIESGRVSGDLLRAAKKAKVRYVGPGGVKGTEPSMVRKQTITIAAGGLVELVAEGSDRLFVRADFVPSQATAVAAADPAPPPLDALPPADAPLPIPALPGATDALPLPPIDGGGALPLPPIDGGGDLPLPSIDGAPAGGDLPPIAPVAVVDEKPSIEYFGEPAEVEIEEMGEVKPYKTMTKGKPLRATINGPGTLMVAVRVASKKGEEPEPFEIKLNVDGSELGVFPLEPKEAPAFAKTRFVKGGSVAQKPSTEEWFVAEIPGPDSLCEFTLDGDIKAGYLNLTMTRKAAGGDGAVVVAVEEGQKPLLSREQLEALQRGSAGGMRSRRARTAWRFTIEIAPGASVLLANTNPGYSGSLGFTMTPPILGGVLGLTFRGGFSAAKGVVESQSSLGGMPATLSIERQRQTISGEAGLHLFLELSRRVHFTLGGGGGYYLASMRAKSFGATSEAEGASIGAWGSLQMGIRGGPGAFFLGGRYFRGEPIENDELTLDVRGVVSELGYAFEF